MEGRGTVWSLEETKALLAIWGQEDIQKCLEKMYRNTEIYDVIVNKMVKMGFDRNSKQCRTKIKQLKADYRRAKDSNKIGHLGAVKSCRFYTELDNILSKYPTKPARISSTPFDEKEADLSDQEYSNNSDDVETQETGTVPDIPTPTSNIIVNANNTQPHQDLTNSIRIQDGGGRVPGACTAPSVKLVSSQPYRTDKLQTVHRRLLNKRKRSWTSAISPTSGNDVVTKLQIENLHAEKEKFEMEKEMLTLKREKLMMEKKLVEYKIKKMKIEIMEKGFKPDLD